jgi:hypothetical protein
MIDTDKIQKLIRLANNNPNENEANLAARKVCSLLNDYKFPIQVKSNIHEPIIRGASNPRQSSWDWMNEYIKNKATRPKARPSDPYTNPWNYPPRGFKYDWYDDPIKEPIKRTLQCKKCGHHKSTEFVGHHTQFMCIDCIGKESFNQNPYTEKNPKIKCACKYCKVEYFTRMNPFICHSCFLQYEKNDNT